MGNTRVGGYGALGASVSVSANKKGFSFEGINRLAAIGRSGRNSEHASTDLLKLMKGIRMPSPFCFQLAVLLFGEAKHFKQYFILPHELFASLFHNYPAHFRQRMLGADGAMERFWEQMQNHPALENNPVTTKRNWKNLYIPFGLHGDGVPISGVGKSWQRSAEVWSWNSLLAWGPTTQMMHFFFA